MKIETQIWDPAENLKNYEDIAAYLEAALEIGDVDLTKVAITDIERAKVLNQKANKKTAR